MVTKRSGYGFQAGIREEIVIDAAVLLERGTFATRDSAWKAAMVNIRERYHIEGMHSPAFTMRDIRDDAWRAVELST